MAGVINFTQQRLRPLYLEGQSALSFSAQGIAHDLLRLLNDRVQMICASQALGVQLVNVFCA
jgi:hypothetical protein